MLMLCLGIACSHVLSVKALPEPSLESSVHCTLFLSASVITTKKDRMGIPVIAGNGCRLFLGDLPESEWVRDGIKAYKDGSLKAVYRKSDGASVQKTDASLLKRLFRL